MDLPVAAIPADRRLRVETVAPAVVRWTSDAWASQQDAATGDIGVGVHFVDLPTSTLASRTLEFAFHWLESGEWAERNYREAVGRVT